MREKSPGRWELRVYASQVDGRKRWVRRMHRGGERSARKAVAELTTEVERRDARPAWKVTVAELLERHIEARSPTGSPNTPCELRLHEAQLPLKRRRQMLRRQGC